MTDASQGPRTPSGLGRRAGRETPLAPPAVVQSAGEHPAGAALPMGMLLDALPEGIFVVGDAGELRGANTAARKAIPDLRQLPLGSTVAAIAGRPLSSFLQETGSGPRTVVVEAAEHRVLELQVSRLIERDDSGAWLFVVRDATTAYASLARALEQERLAAIGQLAAGMAHDFNNIMTVVILEGQMALRAVGLPPEAAEHLGIIVEQGERASHLIQQILDFTRQSVTEPRPVDLRLFMLDTRSILARTLPEDIQVELQFDADRYIIRGDVPRLQQMFLNLALNARDAMPAGGTIEVAFRTLPATGPGGHPGVEICFSDTGKGIPAEVVPHVFEPFYTTKPPGKGTGLGLAQVYGIVLQHGGTIEVASEVGQRTEFRLTFPLLDGESAVAAAAGGMSLPEGRGETILLVEDDPATRNAIAELLETLNYNVVLAEDGRQALEEYQRAPRRVSLVLSDVVMPVLGGPSLSQMLRKLDPSIRILLMTGHPLTEEGKQMLAAGEVSWLQKPLGAELLARAVAEAIGS